MRYERGGGLTAAQRVRREGTQRVRREQVRLRAAGLFARGYTGTEVAKELQVTRVSANCWHRACSQWETRAPAFNGPASLPRLDGAQFARLQAALSQGPAAHGWDDRHWMLARVTTMIGRMFRLSYSLPGVWKLLRRHGWSCQVPARRVGERDEDAIVTWKEQVWPIAEPRSHFGELPAQALCDGF